MKTRKGLASTTVALLIALTMSVNPEASADTDEWNLTSEVLFSEGVTPVETRIAGNGKPDNAVTPQDATGTTYAPGGLMASNTIHVKGKGTFVRNAGVSYMVGTDVGNACADRFEIAYYEKGQRRVQSAAGHCAPGRVYKEFAIGRHLDNNRPFCGRAKVGGTWGNYACVTIKA